MMDENQFWATLHKVIAVVICVLILSVGGCTIYESTLVADMVKAGADPINARCSMAAPTSPLSQCTLRAAKTCSPPGG